jgi:hypothetical protein
MDSERLTDLVESSDLAGLIRFLDDLVRSRDWDGIVAVRDRCREAVDRGKQVWAVAELAEYRLALDAPGRYAGAVVGDGKGRFALGPLWEVAASTHTWAEIEDYVSSPMARAMVGHERVVRGEDLRDADLDHAVLELPLVLQSWEPRYAVASYRPDAADFPERPGTDLVWTELAGPAEEVPDDGPGHALLELVQPWSEQSSGHAVAMQVAGTAREAIRSLGPHRVRLAEVELDEAVATMAWAGASGGAFGRRRGTPVGRAGAWWVLAELLGYDEIPVEAEGLQEAAELRWYRWDPGDRIGGWSYHMAVEDPEDGLAWVISAVDMR